MSFGQFGTMSDCEWYVKKLPRLGGGFVGKAGVPGNPDRPNVCDVGYYKLL